MGVAVHLLFNNLQPNNPIAFNSIYLEFNKFIVNSRCFFLNVYILKMILINVSQSIQQPTGKCCSGLPALRPPAHAPYFVLGTSTLAKTLASIGSAF